MTRWWVTMAGIAMAGIWITLWIDESTKASFPAGPGARPAEWAMLPFWALYLISTHLLAPWDIMRRRNATVPREIQSGDLVAYPWWAWLFLGPYFLKDARAKVPTPVSAVLVWVLCILSAWLFLILSILTLVGIHGEVHSPA